VRFIDESPTNYLK